LRIGRVNAIDLENSWCPGYLLVDNHRKSTEVNNMTEFWLVRHGETLWNPQKNPQVLEKPVENRLIYVQNCG